MSDDGACPHFSAKVQDDEIGPVVLATYKSVVAWGVSRFQVTKNIAKRRKISSPSCHTCKVYLTRPFACLQCSYTGCWTDKHIVDHLADEEHTLGVDAKSGFVFCSDCNDFIYHPQLEDLRVGASISAEENLTRFQDGQKLRESYESWSPTPKEIEAIQASVPISCQGRRGLLNLGQTCFLNAVLQCLAHNPLLRNYFLGDSHNSRGCKTDNCTCCEMDRLFSEIYSEDSNPYGPVSFLATTWRASSELSGYAQQDAHEFFISALNQIHSTSRGHTNVSCNCIVHSTFAGQLQSDVKCERCGNVTSTVDPMLDISLELKDKTNDGPGGNTLAGCLRRFTHPEKLGSKEYSCSKCGKAHEASKRLSIRKLPPVLSFQFKRFEYTSADKSSARKIDASVRFPATINMAPFTTLAMNSSEKEKVPVLHTAPGPNTIYEYDLFAVINHEGQMDNGHYTNFARFQDEWYRFDDEKVTPSNLGTCLNSAAYMCFYVKRHLEYRPVSKPTYVVTRETEAIREKEMEKVKEAARLKEVEDALLATL